MKLAAYVARVVCSNEVFLYDTINRTPMYWLATIKVAEDILGLLPKGTHEPDLLTKPKELVS